MHDLAAKCFPHKLTLCRLKTVWPENLHYDELLEGSDLLRDLLREILFCSFRLGKFTPNLFIFEADTSNKPAEGVGKHCKRVFSIG